MIFHITTAILWEQAVNNEVYEPDSLKNEGFIHCSSRVQVLGAASRYFQGHNRLILVAIDESRLGKELIWENTTGGTEPFPHLYKALDMACVIATASFDRDVNGNFQFPPSLEEQG